MKEREKCYYSLACAHISLEKSLHTDIPLHILEHLKEGDFLVICQRKGELPDSFFHKFSIQRRSSHMSDTGFLDDFFSLQSLVLEFKEFLVGQFMLCELVGLESFWRMERSDVYYTGAMCTHLLYFFG